MRVVRMIGLMVAVVASVTLLAACGDDEPSSNGASATPTEGQAGADDSPPAGDTFFLEIAAENTEYDVSELGPAPAGEDITLQFDNDDPGIQHNWSLYETEESTDPIFEGKILTGVDTEDYFVPAIDEPGTYHYHCDIHPAVMTGELIIE
jgi:plastocyanin